MSQWHYYRRGDCPVCLGQRKDCRQSRSTELVHCRSTDANPPDWNFVGEDSLGFGMWVERRLAEEQDAERRAEYQRQRELERQKRLETEARQRAEALSVDARSPQFRRLLLQLSLDDDHRQNLKERGLTDEQIKAGLFRTVVSGQKVSDISPRLPGITADNRLIFGKFGTRGFLCPAFDSYGRITGCQIRLDDATVGKYRWLKSKFSSHLPNGELPLTVAYPVNCDPKTIKRVVPIEGIGKPFFAAQIHGVIAIGASGGNFANSKKQLKAALEQLSKNHDNLVLSFVPDAGGVSNKNVFKRDRTTLRLLKSWGYRVQVANWGQWYDKSQPDFDELPPDADIQWVEADEYLKLGNAELVDILQRFGQRLRHARKKRSGFDPAPPPTTNNKSSVKPSGIQPYKLHQRIETWRNGGQFVADFSATGTGKNFDVGRLEPLSLGAQQIILVSNDPRNPSTPTLEDWDILEGRHGGLKRDAHHRLRRCQSGETGSVAPNCIRNQTINVLRSAGIEDTKDNVCLACPVYEACQGGKVAGYLGKRRTVLGQPQIISHPYSLPDPTEFDYSQTVIVWDETQDTFKTHKTLTVSVADLQKLTAHLTFYAPALSTQLQPWLTALYEVFQGKQPRYGRSHHELVKTLSQLPDNLDFEAIEAVTQPNLDCLNPTAEYGVDLADLPPQARRKLADSDSYTATQAQETVLKQWIVPTLKAFAGQGGYVTMQQGQLHVSAPQPRLTKIAQAARQNIFLDATGNLEELALLLEQSPDEINAVAVESEDAAKVKVVQVTGMGRLGQQRGNYQQKQVEAVLDTLQAQYPDAGVIRFKRYAQEQDLRWYIDSRGVNDLEKANTLILDGIPCPNLEALKAEFAVLYHHIPTDETEEITYPISLSNGQTMSYKMRVSCDALFREFVARRVVSTIQQAIGRLRASRRPGESLTVYLLGEYPLPFPVEVVAASEITPEAMTKFERFEQAIRNAVKELISQGQKVTQTAVAQMTSYSQPYISRFKELLLLFVESEKAKVIISPTEAELVDDLVPVIENVVNSPPPDQPPGEILNDVCEVFLEWVSPQQAILLWERLSAVTQQRLWTLLLLVAPEAIPALRV